MLLNGLAPWAPSLGPWLEAFGPQLTDPYWLPAEARASAVIMGHTAAFPILQGRTTQSAPRHEGNAQAATAFWNKCSQGLEDIATRDGQANRGTAIHLQRSIRKMCGDFAAGQDAFLFKLQDELFLSLKLHLPILQGEEEGQPVIPVTALDHTLATKLVLEKKIQFNQLEQDGCRFMGCEGKVQVCSWAEDEVKNFTRMIMYNATTTTPTAWHRKHMPRVLNDSSKSPWFASYLTPVDLTRLVLISSSAPANKVGRAASNPEMAAVFQPMLVEFLRNSGQLGSNYEIKYMATASPDASSVAAALAAVGRTPASTPLPAQQLPPQQLPPGKPAAKQLPGPQVLVKQLAASKEAGGSTAAAANAATTSEDTTTAAASAAVTPAIAAIAPGVAAATSSTAPPPQPPAATITSVDSTSRSVGSPQPPSTSTPAVTTSTTPTSGDGEWLTGSEDAVTVMEDLMVLMYGEEALHRLKEEVAADTAARFASAIE